MDKIAVIIIHYGEADATNNCIASIKGLDNGDKIIVVDNSGNYFFEKEDLIVLKQKKNLGFGGGLNAGLEFAIGKGYENFVVSNNDIVFADNFFTYLKNEILSKSTFQNKIISPKINYLTNKNLIWFNGGYIDYVCMEGKHFDFNKDENEIAKSKQSETDFFTGAVFVISSGVFNKIGKFNEAFFLYYEDLDYSLRAKEKGVKIIHNPDLLAFHSVSLNTQSKKRFIAEKLINDKGKHFVGLIGARGVGKSVLFKQLVSQNEDSIYISVDSIEIENLFELIKTLHKYYQFDVFYLDEIHFYKGCDKDLKTIYDFLNVKIFFTSSVSLSLFDSAYDLARRIKIFNIYPFSYREYLAIKEDIYLDTLSLKDIKEKKWKPEHLREGMRFKDFIRGGLMPYSLEEPDILQMQKNILDKIIYRDIPFVAQLKTGELEIIKKVVKFIGKAEIDGINYSSLSNNLKITKYKAEQYVELLERAFVINVVFPKGTNVLKEPKIVMNLPYRLLYNEYNDVVGGLREDFFVETMKMTGKKINYLKTKKGKKTPDYLVEENGSKYIIEVGGKGKGYSQFKGIDMSKSIIFVDAERVDGIRRPLVLTGFLK